jgi:hypothetical protein
VELSLWSPGKEGASNVIRLPYAVGDARRLADQITGTADAVELDARARAGDDEAAMLLEHVRKQLSEAEPIPPWFEDL